MDEMKRLTEENKSLRRQLAAIMSYAASYESPPHGLDEPAVPLPALCPNATLSGVYFLCLKGVVVYVGQSISVLGRISNHVVDATKQWDAVYFIPYDMDVLSQAETHWIDKLKPFYNLEGKARTAEKAMKRAARDRQARKATGGVVFVTASPS